MKYRARVKQTIMYELEFDATSKQDAWDTAWNALEDLEVDGSTTRFKIVDQFVNSADVFETWEMEPGAIDE